MDYLVFNIAALSLIVTVIIFAFCAGVFVPVFARATANKIGQAPSLFARFFAFVRQKGGHLASFAAGGILVAVFTMTTSPYYWYSWSNSYEAIEVGRVIIDNDDIMATGQIPQEVMDWYNRRQVGRDE
jgi:hypothetical protein